MFTGIVQGIGEILNVENFPHFLRYTLLFPKKLLDGLTTGTSVAVNGICQTVVKVSKEEVTFEAISETLHKTTLNSATLGQRVNLERAAKFGEEIGGHLLSGHIFGCAKILQINQNIYTFVAPGNCIKYLFSKGFIALDGISLTLVDVFPSASRFSVHLIPETLARTTLSTKREGDFVNVEIDSQTQITVDTLSRIKQSEHAYCHKS